MKLIIEHHYSDGFTYCGANVIPIERESEESLLCELEEWAQLDNEYGWNGTGIFASTVLGRNQTDSIDIYTLDDWWKVNAI